MFVIYANDEDAKCDWAKYRDATNFNSEKFRCGVKAVFDRSKKRMDEMRKVACANQANQGFEISI